VTVLALRSQAPVAHTSDAGQGPEAIDADLGALGEVNVSFQPSGRTRVTHLNLSGKIKGCNAPRRIVRRLGTFTARRRLYLDRTNMAGLNLSALNSRSLASPVDSRIRSIRDLVGSIHPLSSRLRRAEWLPAYETQDSCRPCNYEGQCESGRGSRYR
jgi:hypothetical protein